MKPDEISSICTQAKQAIASLEKLSIIKAEIDEAMSHVQQTISEILPKLEDLE